ncbi:MAG: HAMP domain-containing sensor histidine kinase [Candidatus Latescibacterota bacterium]
MAVAPLPTEFAPAERDPQGEIEQQVGRLQDVALVGQLLNAMPGLALVLNDKRQITFANRRLLEVLGIATAREVYGARPGEVLNCVHADEHAGGCGTSRSCRYCGAVLAILSAQRGKGEVRECQVLRKGDGGGLNLQVSTVPWDLQGRRYTIFGAADTSHEKRRQAMERSLFRGILARARELQSELVGLQGQVPEPLQGTVAQAARGAAAIVEGINEFQVLAAAESGALRPRPVDVVTGELLQQVVAFFRQRGEGEVSVVHVDSRGALANLSGDPVLLKIILCHLVRNALEASPGKTAKLTAYGRGDAVEFVVHNPEPMPEEVQARVFQRGYTTKGEGRGLGTYTTKLLSEKYLDGCVSFTSTPEMGTLFRAQYPARRRSGGASTAPPVAPSKA